MTKEYVISTTSDKDTVSSPEISDTSLILIGAPILQVNVLTFSMTRRGEIHVIFGTKNLIFTSAVTKQDNFTEIAVGEMRKSFELSEQVDDLENSLLDFMRYTQEIKEGSASKDG